jgi:hypothetical protein
VAGYASKPRRLAWPNVLLAGGGVAVLVVSFLLVLSMIRSYVEPPKIPAARPMLASAEETQIELTGFSGPHLSPIEIARASAIQDLAAAMRTSSASTRTEESTPPSGVAPPARRPRAETATQLSAGVPLPRPRRRD